MLGTKYTQQMWTERKRETYTKYHRHPVFKVLLNKSTSLQNKTLWSQSTLILSLEKRQSIITWLFCRHSSALAHCLTEADFLVLLNCFSLKMTLQESTLSHQHEWVYNEEAAKTPIHPPTHGMADFCTLLQILNKYLCVCVGGGGSLSSGCDPANHLQSASPFNIIE